MTDDDMLIREAAREICAEVATWRDMPEDYIRGLHDHHSDVRIIEKAIRKGIEIGRSL